MMNRKDEEVSPRPERRKAFLRDGQPVRRVVGLML